MSNLFRKKKFMKTKDFCFDLPNELIAQHPVSPRDHSRLLVLNRKSGEIAHRHFYNILDFLEKGDCLIVNDSRVLPARIFGARPGKAEDVEFLLLHQTAPDTWETICKPGKKAKIGTIFCFGGGKLTGTVTDITTEGSRIIKFSYEGNFYAVLEEIGNMPLPPYITEKLTDNEQYQTVYAKEPGSAAAPTAGLHFTEELMEQIRQKGVEIGYVTLHVGLGTFRPVKVADVTKHKMHSEHFEIPEETARLIQTTRQNGGRVIAVGTTSCRTLESAADKGILNGYCEGWTDIFIYPGYQFQILDGLITNFHLPESTLIMLVSAFAGHENTMKAYQEAIKEQYRFFSFGDAMLIV